MTAQKKNAAPPPDGKGVNANGKKAPSTDGGGKSKSTRHKASIRDLEAQLEAARKEAQENYDRFLRVSAEFENYKKRAAREMADFKKFANESFVQQLLPVVDNLERAIAACSENDAAASGGVLQGIRMTLDEILKVFEKFVVKPIHALGQPFDPNFHQAVMQKETDKDPGNTVIEELQKGYTIHDRLLRPAMVVVSKAGEKDNSKQACKRA